MNQFTSFFRKIPVWIEFVAVIGLCFGLPTASSIYSFHSGKAFENVDLGLEQGIGILAWEFLVSFIVIIFCVLRGFPFWKHLAWTPTLKSTLLGVGLLVAANLAYIILFNIVILIVGVPSLHVAKYSMTMPVWLVLAVSLINPIFEETFVVGYVFERGGGLGIWPVVLISCVLRVSYHLYQGWIGVISILPLGIIFGLAYAKTNRLWPLFLAHAIQDFVALNFSSN